MVSIPHSWSTNWLTRKRFIESVISPGLGVTARVSTSRDGLLQVEASIVGADFSGGQYATGWYEINSLFNGIESWNAGQFIQTALHFMPAGEREWVKTGLSPSDLGGDD